MCVCFYFFRVECFKRYTKVASKMCSARISDLNGRCQTYADYRTILSLCAFIVFCPYKLQNPRGKSNNSILVPNKFLNEKQGIT